MAKTDKAVEEGVEKIADALEGQFSPRQIGEVAEIVKDQVRISGDPGHVKAVADYIIDSAIPAKK